MPDVLTCQSLFDIRKSTSCCLFMFFINSRTSFGKLIFVSSLLSGLPTNIAMLWGRLGANFFVLWLVIPFLPRAIVVIHNYCKWLNRAQSCNKILKRWRLCLSFSRPQPRHSCIWLLTPIPHFKQGRGIWLPLLMLFLWSLQYSSRQDFPHISRFPFFNHGQILYPLWPLIFKYTAFI